MSKWLINRVGLLNFWYYQNQIFEFANGKMLLRGTNGSGKSLTMQSLFPVLFDGDTSAYRLDSFGSRDRKMDEYLLGEKNVSEEDERTGYLFLEVKKENREEYLTVGIGLHARRGGKLSKWFFVVENNQRIGIDLELYEEIRKDELVPFTRIKLKNRLEGKGRLFETQHAYKKFVNERIFGFSTMEQFDELIALLINLRSPKLSKDFRPTVIYGILRDSLPKLKEEEVLTLSKTIEQLEGHQERLGIVTTEIRDLDRFAKVYIRWQEEFIGQIAEKWLEIRNTKNRRTRDVQTLSEENKQVMLELNQEEVLKIENNNQLKALEQIIEELHQHDGINLVRRGEELKETLDSIAQDIHNQTQNKQLKQQQLTDYQQTVDAQQQQREKYVKEMEEYLEDNECEGYATLLHLELLDSDYTKKFQATLSEKEYVYWQSEITKRKKHFQELSQRIQKFEYLERQLRTEERALGEIQQKLDELQRDMRHWQQTRQDEIEHWKQALESWRQHAAFPLSEKQSATISYQMNLLLEEEIREEQVLALVTESYQQALTDNQTQLVALESHCQEVEQKKQRLQQEIREWEAQKMPVVPQSKDRQKNRDQLTGKNYVPFYQSVDFLPSVSQNTKDGLEGALFASGLLDSLISTEGLLLADDSQILPKPKFFTTTLSDFLTVNQEIDPILQPLVADILQSVVVDEVDSELPSIFQEGHYYLANIKGQMPIDYQASYIGATSQARYRQTMIANLQQELAVWSEESHQLAMRVEENKTIRQAIQQSYQQRPKGTEVYEAIDQKNKVLNEWQSEQGVFERKQQEVNRYIQQMRQETIVLHDLAAGDGLALKSTVYQEMVTYAENYSANIKDAYTQYQLLSSNYQHMDSLQKTVRLYQREVEELIQMIDELNAAYHRYERFVKENLKQQEIANVEALQQQLHTARQEKHSRDELRNHTEDNIILLSQKVAENQVKLTANQEELALITYQERLWQQLFEKEVYQMTNDSNYQNQLVTLAREKRRTVDVKRLKSRSDNVIKQFSFIREQLPDYQPSLNTVTCVDIPSENQQLGEFLYYNQYQKPAFLSEGQTQTVFDLLEQLKAQKLTLQDLLQKDDEKLFKRVILESVGNILRVRINQSMEWIEKMNRLLQEQKNSSGLSLSIHWKGLASTSEKDLGTKKLVSLLQKPVTLLSETDRLAISRHFQEKVQLAQDIAQQNEENRSTLFQAITQVLDYRDWFEFELTYKRANEGYQSQTLSDKKFNQFSGGEKAISMYLPLFAAVHSRYSDAKEFCPKMITLDEAFAGIDDRNIAELFKACEQLGFNYVMNSQALFGDYPTVSQLMIYELLRPQNINLVTAIRYYWDGNQKHLLLEELIMDE